MNLDELQQDPTKLTLVTISAERTGKFVSRYTYTIMQAEE